MRIKNIFDYRVVENLFFFTRQTWSKWKKENRPIVNLIEIYFTNDDLKEFLETGKIQKQDRLKELLEIEKKYYQIAGIINNKSQQDMQ